MLSDVPAIVAFKTLFLRKHQVLPDVHCCLRVKSFPLNLYKPLNLKPSKPYITLNRFASTACFSDLPANVAFPIFFCKHVCVFLVLPANVALLYSFASIYLWVLSDLPAGLAFA